MSDIGVEGDQNRVAGRDYLEINLGGQDREPLAQAQRVRLNEEVARLAEELGMDPRMLWRSVHESTGVKAIGEIKKDQFQAALSSLQAVRDRNLEIARAQTLITHVHAVIADKGLAVDVERFCLREFGESSLQRLTIMQLTQVLKFADSAQLWEPQLDSPRTTTGWPAIRAVLLNYPWHFGAVFMIGLLVGRLF